MSMTVIEQGADDDQVRKRLQEGDVIFQELKAALARIAPPLPQCVLIRTDSLNELLSERASIRAELEKALRELSELKTREAQVEAREYAVAQAVRDLSIFVERAKTWRAQ